MIDGDNKKLLSDKTISKWFEIFRLAIAQEMVTRDKDKKIGGEGMEVEIDESCFGTLKYGRGNPYRHRQCWVLGGIVDKQRSVSSRFVKMAYETKRYSTKL